MDACTNVHFMSAWRSMKHFARSSPESLTPSFARSSPSWKTGTLRFTRRAKEIAAMRPAEGVKLFRREIPGALPLLKYFYDNLSEDWLPFLEKEGLLGEPLPDDQLADLSRLRAWPAGQYNISSAWPHRRMRKPARLRRARFGRWGRPPIRTSSMPGRMRWQRYRCRKRQRWLMSWKAG